MVPTHQGMAAGGVGTSTTLGLWGGAVTQQPVLKGYLLGVVQVDNSDLLAFFNEKYSVP